MFHADEETCVKAQSFKALTLLRKCKLFHVIEVKVLRETQRCEAGVERPFGGLVAVIRSEHNSEPLQSLFVNYYCLLSDMTSLPFYIFHSDISTRRAKLDLGRLVEYCGYGSRGEVTRLVLGQ